MNQDQHEFGETSPQPHPQPPPISGPQRSEFAHRPQPGLQQPPPPHAQPPGGYGPGGGSGGPPPPGWRPQPQPYGFPPQVVHIVSKPGGFARAVGFIIGILLFGGIFLLGIMIGAAMFFASASTQTMTVQELYREGASSQRIAIIPVEGVIDDGQAEFVRSAVKDVLDDSNVRAVVLRVDSPGGGVTASDQIWYEVERLKKAGVPVVASYGGLAASGGYYVSCGADHIIAEETCITGSIGVIAQILTLDGLMDKVGIEPVTLVASGSPNKAVANDIFRTWTEQDRQKVRAMLDAAYNVFTDRVKAGRQASISDSARLAGVANGDIYTAKQAIDHGLVDAVGYLDDAIAHAESLAGIGGGRATVVRMRMPSLFGGSLFAEAAGAHGAATMMDADRLRALANDLASPRVMYLMR